MVKLILGVAFKILAKAFAQTARGAAKVSCSCSKLNQKCIHRSPQSKKKSQ